MSNKLTPKQKKFVDNYILSGNATDAAIRAGYSKKCAQQIGAENLLKPVILTYYEKRIEALDLASMMQQKEVLQRLTRIGRREEKETVVMMAKNRKSFYDEKGKKVIEEDETPLLIEIPSKLSDTNKALELLGKHHMLFVDRLETNQTIAVVSKLDSILDELKDDEQLEETNGTV